MAQPTEPTAAKLREQGRGLLHPVSGAVVLGLDWLLFGAGALSAFGLIWLTSLLGLLLGGGAVAIAQRRFGGDSLRASLWKGALGGLVVAVPFPVGGTALGGMVLALSGLDRWRKWLRR